MDKVSESIFESRKHDKVSSMIIAMRDWETSLASPDEKPSGQFGRVVKIESEGLTIDNSLDVEFNVPFDDEVESNEAEITIYNLSKTTIGRLKADAEISITAGYGTDTGVIFSGVISKVNTRWSGQDKVTTISAIDDVRQKDKDIDSISFNAGVKASYILKTLVGKLGLPIAVFKVRRDHTYTEAVTVSGGLMNNIKSYAEVCGVSAYINKRKVYVRHLSDGDNLGFTVNVDTGLLDSPEEFTEEVDNEYYTETVKGIKFKMLLEHRITTAAIITLQSRDFTGTYRVREGSHVCNESDFYTEITAIEGDVPSTTKSGTVKTTTKKTTTTKKASSASGGGGKYVEMIK